MKTETTKEYNDLLFVACDMESTVRFYCGSDELCRRKVLEAAMKLNYAVIAWNKSLDEGEETKCEYCDGNTDECELAGRFECPRIPKNNEEYIRSCSVEELAEFLVEHAEEMTAPDGDYHKHVERFVVEWLKEKHDAS